ncbi:MAG: ABC transporter permease, partial [Clostridia bacterium]|nr:ABC transporter permease [Clostridia bacterium]
MIKVSNRKIIRHIALQELKNSKKMNAVVVMSIILTCLMFTSLTSIGGSLMNGIREETMRQVGGDKMAGVKCVLPEDYEKILSDNAVRNVVYRIAVGRADDENIKDIMVELNCAGSDEAAKSTYCMPTTGTLPSSISQIAASTLVLDEMGITPEIGTKVPLTIDIDGKKLSYEFELCGYWEGDRVAVAQECWVSRDFADKYAKTPTVNFKDTEGIKYAGYWMVDFDYANSWDIEGKTVELLTRLYGDLATAPDVGINWAYNTNSISTGMIEGAAALLAVIFIAGYLIIYNIFYINISANIRNYGLLKTIGTTSRQ